MIKNYIIIALRNLRKHKFFAAINIVGLSLSMSVCLVLILLVYDQFQYDKFHPNGDRTYRVITYRDGQDGTFDDVYATSPLPIKEHLENQYAFIERMTNLNHQFRGEIRSPHKILELSSLFADEHFFEVFGFELLEGSATGMAEPFNLLLNESMAGKLFPNQSPVGKTVSFADHGDYKVIGVVKDAPGNSHIKFEALASFSTLPLLVEKEVFTTRYQEWDNIWGNYNYLVLSNSESRAEAEKVINELASQNIELKEDHPGYKMELQGINEIVPGRIMSNEIGFTFPWFILAFFGLLGLIVMITATINYTNLSIARSLSRTKEIGIRKVNGARRQQIVGQFLVESVIITLISLIVGIVIYKFLIQSFNELWIFSTIGITLQESWGAYVYFFGFTIFLGVIAGIGPSLFISKINTISSLKGSLAGIQSRKKSVLSLLTGKRTLLSFQFSLSILMLVSILALNDQANFLVNSNFGFDDSEVFFVETQGHDPEIIKEEFASIAGINQISFTSHHPAVGRSHGDKAYWKPDQEPQNLSFFSVDPSYMDVMSLELLAGSDFPKNASQQNEKFIILNEKAVDIFGFESTTQAIGEVITIDTIGLTILGVVKDYHWEPLMKSIRPLGLRIIPDMIEFAYFNVSNVNGTETKKVFEERWTSFDSAREFKGGFLDAQIDEYYQFFYDIGGILGYVSLLAVAITSLGFLGMVSFELKTKVKEIGIRKVLGANFRELTLTMSKGFLILIVLTTAVAAPLAIWINSMWVNSMASHAPLSILNAVPAVLIIGIICLSAILSQVWTNSKKNPAETLRAD
ncbi:MAG: ABC transporter permease [Cyclobacteriaceae bacterium]